jgi:hypothetical protein
MVCGKILFRPDCQILNVYSLRFLFFAELTGLSNKFFALFKSPDRGVPNRKFGRLPNFQFGTPLQLFRVCRNIIDSPLMAEYRRGR